MLKIYFQSLIAIAFMVCSTLVVAEDPPKEYKIIVDIGSNMTPRGVATLKTSQILGGDGLLESVKSNAPKELENNLVVILEQAESNGFLTKYEIVYTILYGSKKFVCEKTIETGFAPGGSYTVNRPKVAFENTSKACLAEFFSQ